MLIVHHGSKEPEAERTAWMVHLDTPVGTISISDKNDQPGGPQFDFEKDEILLNLAGVPNADWHRFTVLDGSGYTWNLGELAEASLKER